MTTIILTVKRLYKLQSEQMVSTSVVIRIYAGDRLIATENVAGMTESPVSKYLSSLPVHHQPLRVEWDCDGVADIAVAVRQTVSDQ